MLTTITRMMFNDTARAVLTRWTLVETPHLTYSVNISFDRVPALQSNLTVNINDHARWDGLAVAFRLLVFLIHAPLPCRGLVVITVFKQHNQIVAAIVKASSVVTLEASLSICRTSAAAWMASGDACAVFIIRFLPLCTRLAGKL